MIRAASFALWLALLGLALSCIALLKTEHTRPNDGLPIVNSDFPICVTVKPPPLQKHKGIVIDGAAKLGDLT
jgi:hypothetical protein